jgi:hypothetical protein
MAQDELSGILVLNEISEDGGTTWKTIVCEDNSQISGTSASTEKKTKCKNFSTTSNNATTVTGSGVSVANIDADEISYKRLQFLRDQRQTVQFRRQNAADADKNIIAGELSYALFEALITEVTETANVEEVVQFNWAVTSTGDIDWGIES